MKFSVLLPTRNRLDLLKNAVHTVMHQAYNNWEIIISDNDSEEDVKSYVDSLSDSRIRYFRTDEFVSVTQNWNNALVQASGDYVIMLGDDDCLVQGFFQIVNELATRFEQPDLIYTDAYLYAYPSVVPGYPQGYLQLGYNLYFGEKREPFSLNWSEAVTIVRQALGMQLPIFYNMQLSVIRREFIEFLADKGPFFQSPFPDYYATVVSLLKSRKTVIFQQPIVIIGISPKSFGYYFFNMKESEGMPILNTLPERAASQLQGVILPGSWELTCRLMAMETVAANYREEMEQLGISVDITEYRRVQVFYNIHALFTYKTINRQDFFKVTRQLKWREYFKYVILQGFHEIIYKRIRYGTPKLLSKSMQTRIRGLLDKVRGERVKLPERISGFSSVLDVFARIPPPNIDS